MSFNELLIGSFCAGLALLAVALALSAKLEASDRRKLNVDTLMKASVVILGLTFGFFSFFSQKIAEDKITRLDDANDALVSLDAFVSEYEGAVAAARVDDDDDDGFPDLVKACAPLKNACDENNAGGIRVKIGTTIDAEEYLNSPYLDQFKPDFVQFISEKPALRRVILPSEITAADDNQLWIVQEYEAIKGDIADSGKLLNGCTDELVGASRNEELSENRNKRCFRATFNACCNILDMNGHSLKLLEREKQQHAAMCEVRTNLVKSLAPLIKDRVLSILAADRVAAIRARVQSLAEASDDKTPSPCGAPPE